MPVQSSNSQECLTALTCVSSVFREDTLRLYFCQFGLIEQVEVMKDRYTSKSRGFGFVTFMDAASANRALAVEHTIDGRRCEAKMALPKVSSLTSVGIGMQDNQEKHGVNHSKKRGMMSVRCM